jgi:hypothetical protein
VEARGSKKRFRDRSTRAHPDNAPVADTSVRTKTNKNFWEEHTTHISFKRFDACMLAGQEKL